MENNLKTIVLIKFGSHLYGTDTKDSDIDRKGIFMPSKEQILLGKIPKCYSENTKIGEGKNTSEDTDTEIYSLHYFLKLACEGQTVACDMLYAPDNMILETSDIWKKIVKERKRFITKNMQAFLGYALRQASKYGIKGSRLSDAKKVLDFINIFYRNTPRLPLNRYFKVKEVWDELPEGEHIYKSGIDPNGNRVYQVCGKKVQETASLEYLYDVIDKFYKAYGARARQAERNENIDWKSVSHAIRAAYQLKELYTEGKITFPLKKADFIKNIKIGKLNYKKEVAPLLETLIEEVKLLAEKSDYPEKVNRKYWDNFIIRTIDNKLFMEIYNEFL